MSHEVTLLRHQADLVADTCTPLLGLVGGLGSAKTYAGACKVAALCAANPGLPGQALAPTYPQLKDYVLPALLEVLPRFGFECRLNRAEMNLYVNVRGIVTQVRLRSSDKPSSQVGSNLAWGWADEAGLHSGEALKKFRARIRHPKAKVRQLVLTGTPEGMHGPFYDWLEGSPQTVDGRPISKAIRARTDDNPFLPDDYVDVALSGFTDAELDAYRNGQFVPPTGRVYSQLDRKVHFTPCEYPLDYAGELVMLCDFNVRLMVWVLATRWEDRLHIWGEIVREDTSTLTQIDFANDVWAPLVQERLGVEHIDGMRANGHVTVICDASARGAHTSATASDMEHLIGAGYRVVDTRANPRIKDSVFAVNKALKEGRLFIDDEGAPYTAKCLAEQPYNKRGEPEKAANAKLGLDHGADCVRYGVWWWWPADQPRGNTGSLYY